jgi:hypothetical protein
MRSQSRIRGVAIFSATLVVFGSQLLRRDYIGRYGVLETKKMALCAGWCDAR